MRDKKAYFRWYYQNKIKPYRKTKAPTGVPHIRCFLCGHLIDFKKYFDKTPSIRIDMKLYTFGGRANIKVEDFSKIDPEISETIRNMLISKLKSMLQALNEPYQPLERVFEQVKAPISREIYNVPAEQKSYVPFRYISTESNSIPTKETTEVKVW